MEKLQFWNHCSIISVNWLISIFMPIEKRSYAKKYTHYHTRLQRYSQYNSMNNYEQIIQYDEITKTFAALNIDYYSAIRGLLDKLKAQHISGVAIQYLARHPCIEKGQAIVYLNCGACKPQQTLTYYNRHQCFLRPY